MSRSARDATRFTPNIAQSYGRATQSGARTRNSSLPSFQSASPSAAFDNGSSRGGTFSSNLGNGRGGPGPSDPYRSETPQQKVARLRAEHLRRKTAQLTTWDRIILRSRNMADAAHRWTIFGILTFSALAGAVTLYSAIDMIRYNRRKNREFYKQYQQLWEQRHADALAAEAEGTATDTQLAIIKQEREAQDFYQRREGQGTWKRVKSAFSFKGLSSDPAGTQSWDKREDLLQRADIVPVGTGVGDAGVLGSIEGERRSAEKQLQNDGFHGGPLDHAAEQAVEALKPASEGRSWFSWGKKSSSS